MAFLILRPGPSFEWDGAPVEFVETVVPVHVETIHARLADGLEQAIQRDPRFRYSFVQPATTGNDLSQDMRAGGPDNIALERYAGLEEGARALDLYVHVPFTRTWHSEYSIDRERVPFHANVGDVFVLALQDAGYETKAAPIYANALIGMITFVGKWWTEHRKPPVEEVAKHISALAWMGLRHLPKRPSLEHV